MLWVWIAGLWDDYTVETPSGKSQNDISLCTTTILCCQSHPVDSALVFPLYKPTFIDLFFFVYFVSVALASHDYILKIVPTVYEDLSGRKRFSYQYTVANKVRNLSPTPMSSYIMELRKKKTRKNNLLVLSVQVYLGDRLSPDTRVTIATAAPPDHNGIRALCVCLGRLWVCWQTVINPPAPLAEQAAGSVCVCTWPKPRPRTHTHTPTSGSHSLSVVMGLLQQCQFNGSV